MESPKHLKTEGYTAQLDSRFEWTEQPANKAIEMQITLNRKERRAKNCLLDMDFECELDQPYEDRDDPTLNGWVGLTPVLPKRPHNKSQSQTISVRGRTVTETSSMIPTLKEELERLESPKKKIKLSGSRLMNLQVISELKNRRKHSLRVSEMMKNRDNRFMMTSMFKRSGDNPFRPFTNAQNRLNQHAANHQAYRNPTELDLLKENQTKRMLKMKLIQSKNLTKIDQARISKSSFYQERKKDKISLKFLLDL